MSAKSAPASDRQALGALLERHFERLRAVCAARGLEEGLSPEQQALSTWQSQRLRRTYADLMGRPRFGPATLFFLEDLYGPEDFSRRDRDVERIYPLLMRVLPAAVMETLARAVELHALTLELDGALIAALLAQGSPPGVTLSSQAYAAAFRACANRPAREAQVALVLEVGADLEQVVRRPLVYTALRMARAPARVAGLGELQDFLERGFGAFRHMGDASEFLATIRARETRILERIFAAEPDPFGG